MLGTGDFIVATAAKSAQGTAFAGAEFLPAVIGRDFARLLLFLFHLIFTEEGDEETQGDKSAGGENHQKRRLIDSGQHINIEDGAVAEKLSDAADKGESTGKSQPHTHTVKK